jgi:hypothetical protein
MKKIFSIFLLLISFYADATILVVKEYGVNNTYASISAAITAAANNDTIVVYDKPSGQAWLEALTIDKNLWIIHPTQGTRFKAPGNVTIVPKAGMDLYIIGWDMMNYTITATSTNATATNTNRARITISDCTNFNNMDLRVEGIEARYFYNQSSTASNTLHFRHGMAVANVLANGGIYVDQETTNDAQNDSILIIGNKGRWCYMDTREGGVIANNYFYNDNCNGDWGTYAGQGNTMLIKYHNQSAASIFYIGNNTLSNDGGNCGNRMSLAFNNSGNMSNVKIVNNIFYTDADAGGPTYGIWYANTVSGQPFISHNYINTRNSGNYTNFSENNELNYKSNVAYAFGSIDTWGRASSGNTTLINKGHYFGEFFDIDLTRNDIGTYGGPYSIDNYLTSGTSKGRVLYINIPHKLSNINQVINLKASGGAKF